MEPEIKDEEKYPHLANLISNFLFLVKVFAIPAQKS